MQKLKCLLKQYVSYMSFFSSLLLQEVELLPRKTVISVSQADGIVPLSILSTLLVVFATVLVDESRNLYKCDFSSDEELQFS